PTFTLFPYTTLFRSVMSEMNHPQATATSSHRAGILRLATARLVLRDWTPADIPDLIEGLNDLRVSRWLAFVPHPYTRADAERWRSEEHTSELQSRFD